MFTNKIDYVALRSAIVKWALGCDDYDGAVGGIYEQIPWSSEMDDLKGWATIEFKFSDAIGNRDTNWNVAKLVDDNETIYRHQFNIYVQNIIDRINTVYLDILNVLNNLIRAKYCIIIKKSVGVVNNIVNYEEIDRIYAETKFECANKVALKYGNGTEWTYPKFIDAVMSFNSVYIKKDLSCQLIINKSNK